MRRLVVAGAIVAVFAVMPVAEGAAATPRAGTWTGKLDDTTYVELKVVRRGARRLVRLEKYQDSIQNGCATSPVGEYLGSPGRALRVRSTGAFSGSFGSFSSPFGARKIDAKGKFTTTKRGSVTVTSSVPGGTAPGCPKTTTFTIRRG